MAEIKRQLGSFERLSLSERVASACSSSRDDIPAMVYAPELQEYAKLLEMLISDDQLHNAVRARLKQLAENVRTGHQSLCWILASGRGWEKEVLRTQVSIERVKDVVYILNSSRWTMPTTLQFYSEAIGNNIKKGMSDDEAVEKFIGERQPGTNYERLLAIAYLVAVFGYWDLAETFCDLALHEPLSESQVPRHEGHYLRAVCRRKSHPSPTRHAQSIVDLDDAAQIKRDIKQEPEYRDPRYLKEKAFHIFAWHESLKDGAETGGSIMPPSVNEAVDLCNEALALVRDDAMLKIQIYNNLCYFYVRRLEDGDIEARESGHEYYRLLLMELKKAGTRVKPIPPPIMDTLCWGRWVLDGDSLDETERMRLSIGLRTALKSEELVPEYRKYLAQHLKILQAGWVIDERAELVGELLTS